MDEKLKLRREMIIKVLGWGTFVYLIVVGYSINQSGLFEFRPDERQSVVDANGKRHQAFEDLERAKFERADQLELEARALNDKIAQSAAETASTEDAMEAKDRENKERSPEVKPSDAAKLKVEAAQLRMEVYLAREQRMDSHQRAQGLMLGAAVYGLVLYPVLVWGVYKRTDPGTGSTEKDLIPLKWALLYAFGMGILTFLIAYRTAMN